MLVESRFRDSLEGVRLRSSDGQSTGGYAPSAHDGRPSGSFGGDPGFSSCWVCASLPYTSGYLLGGGREGFSKRGSGVGSNCNSLIIGPSSCRVMNERRGHLKVATRN